MLQVQLPRTFRVIRFFLYTYFKYVRTWRLKRFCFHLSCLSGAELTPVLLLSFIRARLGRSILIRQVARPLVFFFSLQRQWAAESFSKRLKKQFKLFSKYVRHRKSYYKFFYQIVNRFRRQCRDFVPFRFFGWRLRMIGRVSRNQRASKLVVKYGRSMGKVSAYKKIVYVLSYHLVKRGIIGLKFWMWVGF